MRPSEGGSYQSHSSSGVSSRNMLVLICAIQGQRTETRVEKCSSQPLVRNHLSTWPRELNWPLSPGEYKQDPKVQWRDVRLKLLYIYYYNWNILTNEGHIQIQSFITFCVPGRRHRADKVWGIGSTLWEINIHQTLEIFFRIFSRHDTVFSSF